MPLFGTGLKGMKSTSLIGSFMRRAILFYCPEVVAVMLFLPEEEEFSYPFLTDVKRMSNQELQPKSCGIGEITALVYGLCMIRGKNIHL